METWREVPGREGYLVSDQGRAAKLMSTNPGVKNRYAQFSIPAPGGGRLREYLHQWVLMAFAGPRPDGAVARHLNDDPTDNRAENLVWGTRSENQLDMYRNRIKSLKTHCKRGHALKGDNLASGRRCRTCRQDRARARYKEVMG